VVWKRKREPIQGVKRGGEDDSTDPILVKQHYPGAMKISGEGKPGFLQKIPFPLRHKQKGTRREKKVSKF